MSDRPPPGRTAPPDPVAAGTRLAAPPYVPEVRLRLADEVFGLWGRTGALPYWAFAWAGGLALARHVLDHPALVAGRSVLDLASGSGLVAIAAARAGAASVLAVDVDPLAGAAITANAAANGVAVSVLVADLLDAPGAGPAGAEAAEVVLAGDVFYERPMARRVLGYLEHARRRGAAVVVGDPGRAYLPRDRFVRVAVHEVPGCGLLEAADTVPVTVWSLP